MRKHKWLPVLGIVLGLALMMSAVPVLAADVDPVVSVAAPAEVPAGGSFTAYVNVDYIEDFAAGTVTVTYDPTVLELTGVSNGSIGGNTIDASGWVWVPGGQVNSGEIFVTLWGNIPGYTGSGYLMDLHFNVIGAVCETSPIHIEGTLSNSVLGEIVATWVDGSVHVCEPRTLVSLKGELPQETDGAADSIYQPPYPPGFEPCDEFKPCEWVWVWGYGFEYCQWYEIYIQPYEPGVSVAPGQPLDHALSAPLGYPEIEPVIVHVAEDGTIGPVRLFHAKEEHICMYWEIVADKVPGPGDNGADIATNPGIYDPNEDGLDAVCLEEYGFHVFPEALTIALFGLGLAGLSGYVLVRRRKGAGSNA
jgi:hypothetical protein